MKWFKKNKEEPSKGGNRKLSEEQKSAREEAKKLAEKAAEDAKAAAAEKAQKARDKATRSSAENRAKVDKEQAKKDKETNSTGKIIRDIISGRFLTEEGMLEHIPYLFFVCVLFLINISLGYVFENVGRDIAKTKRQFEEVNSDYKTLMSDLEARLQQSRVETATKDLGLDLIQPNKQPFLLEENADE